MDSKRLSLSSEGFPGPANVGTIQFGLVVEREEHLNSLSTVNEEEDRMPAASDPMVTCHDLHRNAFFLKAKLHLMYSTTPKPDYSFCSRILCPCSACFIRSS